MSEADNDPRVYFAAERTMLAWLRTGIAVMAFAFVVLGVVATGGGALQYQCYVGSLPDSARPPTSIPRFILGLSWALVLIGAADAAQWTTGFHRVVCG